MTYNGERAVGIAVAAASGTDIVKVGNAVERRLAELQEERFPAGVACHKVFYQPERVTGALSTFFINLVESVLIVIAILMITMGFRSGVIIGFSLLTIVIGTFLLLGMTGGTMQQVSLAAFILAMGMLVDNAIVIVDGILVDLVGKPRREACAPSVVKPPCRCSELRSLPSSHFCPFSFRPIRQASMCAICLSCWRRVCC